MVHLLSVVSASLVIAEVSLEGPRLYFGWFEQMGDGVGLSASLGAWHCVQAHLAGGGAGTIRTASAARPGSATKAGHVEAAIVDGDVHLSPSAPVAATGKSSAAWSVCKLPGGGSNLTALMEPGIAAMVARAVCGTSLGTGCSMHGGFSHS